MSYYFQLTFPTFRYITPFLHGNRVLDIGCNVGNYLGLFSTVSIGMDLDSEYLLTCRQKKLVILQANADRALPFQAQTFDAVLASHVLEHLHAPVDFLYEVGRVLVPGGTLAVGVPVEGGLASIRFRYFRGHEGHLYSFSPENLYYLLHVTGFIPTQSFFHIWRIGYCPQLTWLSDLMQHLPKRLLAKLSVAYWVVSRKS